MSASWPHSRRFGWERVAVCLRRLRGVAPLLALGGGCAAEPKANAPATFDTIPEAYARPTGALMAAGAARAFLVDDAGNLAGGEWNIRFALEANDVTAAPPRTIASEDRWLPVLHWSRVANAVRFDAEAVASAGPAPRDTGLIVSLQWTVTNRGRAPAEVSIAATLDPIDGSALFRSADPAADAAVPFAWSAGGARLNWSDATRARGWSDLPLPKGHPAIRFTLAPGGSRRVRFVLPGYAEPPGRLADWARRPHADAVREARREWHREIEAGTRFSLGDSVLERALDAAEVVLLSCRERRGPDWVPIGNPFQYRDVWLRDGARAIRALAVSGHVDEARELGEGLLRLQWPNGAFLSQHGQLDGSGQALWALEQSQLRGPPEPARIHRAATAALATWRWCESQRSAGRNRGWAFGTMMPFCDPHDGELARAQLVGTDAWTLCGYRSAVRLLSAAGLAAEADSVERSRLEYLAEFERLLPRAGGDDVKPSWQGIGRDWGNLAVADPCGVGDVRDPRFERLARRLWAQVGGPGLVSYGERDSLHGYVGADLAAWAIRAGHRSEAESVLAQIVRWRTASGGAAEIFSRSSRDFGRNLPPHATSAAALLSLVRDMLVADDDDTLHLTRGATAAWWRGANVARAPTRFGAIDLSFARAGDHARWQWTPVSSWTALTLPPGTRLAHAPALPLRAAGDRALVAPPGTAAAEADLAPEARR